MNKFFLSSSLKFVNQNGLDNKIMESSHYSYQDRPSNFLNYHCLDFNEYQGAISPSASKILQNNTELLRYYPNTKDSLLLLEISQVFKVPIESLALANGADEALFHILLMQKFHNKYEKVQPYFTLTYDHFLHFAKNLGFAVSKTENHEFKDEIIYLSFPNNPTGEEISPERLEEIIKNSENSLWILDITYLFYSHYKIEDYIQKVLSYENVITVMSFSKSFPMAGLRMAFVLSANLKIINYFKKEYNQKTVGAFARLLALDCLKHKKFYEEQRKQIWSNRDRLAQIFYKASCKKKLSLKPLPLDSKGGNFFLMGGGDLEDRKSFVEFLYSVKIIVRAKPHWNFFRVTSVSNGVFDKIKRALETA